MKMLLVYFVKNQFDAKFNVLAVDMFNISKIKVWQVLSVKQLCVAE